MSVGNTLATCPAVQVGDLAVFANAGVDAEVAITLHASKLPDDEIVSILFGDERITLEFSDAESLERLRDLADEGARRLRAAIETNAQAAADDASAADRPGELAGGGAW